MRNEFSLIISLILIPISLLNAQVAQQCTLVGDNFTFDSPNIGTVVTNPTADVNINYSYTIPTEEIEKITFQINEFYKLKEEINSQRLGLEKREQIIKQREEDFIQKQQQLVQDRKLNKQTQNDIEESKKNFALDMQKVKSRISKSNCISSQRPSG